jgi:hypothetical protein
VEDFQGEAEAMPLFEEVLAREPEHARAHLSVGRILVLRDEATAVEHLERAARLDRRLEGAASQLLGVYWSRQGRSEEVQHARNRETEWVHSAEAAHAERSRVDLSDALALHGLDPATLERLRSTFARFPEVRGAWMARKVLRHFPENPLFVLVLRAGSRWSLRKTEQFQKLGVRVLPELTLPGGVVLLDFRTDPVADRVRRLRDSEVYRRA